MVLNLTSIWFVSFYSQGVQYARVNLQKHLYQLCSGTLSFHLIWHWFWCLYAADTRNLGTSDKFLAVPKPESITYLITLDWKIGWWTCLPGKKKAASDFAHSLTHLSVVSSREFFYFSPSFWDICLSFPTLPSHKRDLLVHLWGNKFSKLSHKIHGTSGSSYRGLVTD